jgi:hypothetical protein
MMYPLMPSSAFDYSKVESIHQVPGPKRKDARSHAKRLRVLAKREIKDQLNAPPGYTR